MEIFGGKTAFIERHFRVARKTENNYKAHDSLRKIKSTELSLLSPDLFWGGSLPQNASGHFRFILDSSAVFNHFGFNQSGSFYPPWG